MENHFSARRNVTLSGLLVKYIFRITLVAITISNPSACQPSWNMIKGPPIKVFCNGRIIDPTFPTFIRAYSSFTALRNVAGWSNYPKRCLTYRRIASAWMQLATASYSKESSLSGCLIIYHALYHPRLQGGKINHEFAWIILYSKGLG